MDNGALTWNLVRMSNENDNRSTANTKYNQKKRIVFFSRRFYNLVKAYVRTEFMKAEREGPVPVMYGACA